MRIVWRAVSVAALFGLSLVAPPQAGMAGARAANYVDTLSLSIDSIRCALLVNLQICSTGMAFTSPRDVKAGDTVTVHADFDAPLRVPGSNGVSVVEVLLADPMAYAGGIGPGPNQARTTVNLRGYSGPAPTYSGPQLTNTNFGYDSAVGFCCDVPTAPYSFTGLDADFEILTDAVRPLAGIVLGYVNTLAATPKALAEFQGGNPDAPRILPAGLVGQITGQIGGDYPPMSFYGFDWQGGLFQTQASIFGADPSASFQFKLFDGSDNLLRKLTLDSSNGFGALMTFGSLAEGFYKIGLATSSSLDPAFQIDFLTPVGVEAAVPEPAAWAMMIAGFGMVGGALRRRGVKAAIA